MRYQKTTDWTEENLPIGTKVRVVLRHPEGWPSLTYEGPIKDLDVERGRVGAISGTRLPDWVRAIVGVGEFKMSFQSMINGWHAVSVERALPPLPTTPGSVVKKGDRAAILTGRVDEPDGVWVWADTGQEVRPGVLDDADIIHAAR